MRYQVVGRRIRVISAFNSCFPISIYAGYLPARAYGLLMEWSILHKEELLETWDLIQQSLPFKKIEGLQ